MFSEYLQLNDLRGLLTSAYRPCPPRRRRAAVDGQGAMKANPASHFGMRGYSVGKLRLELGGGVRYNSR